MKNERLWKGDIDISLDAMPTFVRACYAGIERHAQVFKTATVELAEEVEQLLGVLIYPEAESF